MSGEPEQESFATLATMWRALESFEAGTWDEVQIEVGGYRLVARVDGGSADVEPVGHVTRPAPVTAPRDETLPGGAAPQPTTMTAPAVPEHPHNAVAVESPTVGIFYAQPEPGAPPFVSVGDRVHEDTTMCIVEVMKLMNHVKAGTSGRVVQVLVDNGGPVERGQALFLVEREAE